MNVDDIKKFFSRVSPISWTVNFLLNRANLANHTLKQKYSSVLRIGTLFGCIFMLLGFCLLYTSPSPRDVEESRMPSSA